jgi:Domain of unknown function (DUF4407)
MKMPDDSMPPNSSAPKRGRFDPFTKLLTMIAGIDDETLRQCPPQDLSSVKAVSVLLLGTFVYSAAVFSTISHRLFAEPGHLDLRLIATSVAIAMFIIAIDSYVFLRCSWFESGVTELARGGLDISGGSNARIKGSVFLSVRVGLSVCLAMLTGTFFSLIVFDKDIHARIENTYQVANAAIVREATTLVDAEIKRTTDAVSAETGQIAALSAQITSLRQNEIDSAPSNPDLQPAQREIDQLITQKADADAAVLKAQSFEASELGGIKQSADNSGHAGNGPRHKAALQEVENARSHAQQVTEALNAARGRLDALRKTFSSANEAVKQRAQNRLPAYESNLAGENVKLASSKDQLTDLTNSRNDAIRKAVESSPNYVPHNTGFLAQIIALEQIANEDGKVASVILLFDLVSVGFELAAVLAKLMGYCPTTYAAIVARDVYMRAVRIVDEMMAELNGGSKAEAVPLENPPFGFAANDNHKSAKVGPIIDMPPSAGSDDPRPSPPQPPKRRRGRPRKIHLLN